MMRRALIIGTSTLMPVAIAAIAMAASIDARTLPPEGGWTYHGAIGAAEHEATQRAKPVNRWTTEGLAAAGWHDCTPSAEGIDPTSPWPDTHIVRTPVAEGFRWVEMPADEVARRIEAFGGTPTEADDPAVVGNCYRNERTA